MQRLDGESRVILRFQIWAMSDVGWDGGNRCAIHLPSEDHHDFVPLLNLSASSKSLFSTPVCDDHSVLKIPSLVCVIFSFSTWHRLSLVAYLSLFLSTLWYGKVLESTVCVLYLTVCPPLRRFLTCLCYRLFTYLDMMVLCENFKSSSDMRFSFSYCPGNLWSQDAIF